MGATSAVTTRPSSVTDDGRARARAELRARLDALEVVPFANAEAAYEPAVAAEAEALAMGDEASAVRARLIRADVIDKRGEHAEAARITQECHDWASEQAEPYLLARSHRGLAGIYMRIGDTGTQLAHSVRAMELLGDTAPWRTRADHLMTLGIALAQTGSFDAADERFEAAEQAAAQHDDTCLSLALINNRAYAAQQAGDTARAQDHADGMVAYAKAAGVPLELQYLDTLAEVHVACGRYQEAARTLAPLLDPTSAVVVNDAADRAECLLTMARVQRLCGAASDAAATLAAAFAEGDQLGLTRVTVRAWAEQAEQHAAAGRFREAYEAHRRFYAGSLDLANEDREAKAQVLLAMFETAEARRASEQWREASLRDPLTGLHNRRYLDLQLPGAIAAARRDGQQLSLAIIDLDRFKSINDRVSHQAGDQVLRQTARLLQEGCSPDAIVTRPGGDEFIVMLPGVDAATAAAQCEHVRRSVGDYPWRDLGSGLAAVTVSIGVADLTAAADATELLAAADRNLYAAKSGGRDRVFRCPSPHPSPRGAE